MQHLVIKENTMPMENKVTPPSGYVKAGSFNSDMKPGKDCRSKDASTRQGLKDSGFEGGIASKGKSGSSPMRAPNSCKKANFTTDADMGLTKDMGKSGKY
jgi:hypothetical protein